MATMDITWTQINGLNRQTMLNAQTYTDEAVETVEQTAKDYTDETVSDIEQNAKDYTDSVAGTTLTEANTYASAQATAAAANAEAAAKQYATSISLSESLRNCLTWSESAGLTVRNTLNGTTFVNLDANGATVQQGTNKTYVSSNGVALFNNNVQTAMFSDTVSLGPLASKHILINTDGIQLLDGATLLASFGESIVLGNTETGVMTINSSGIELGTQAMGKPYLSLTESGIVIKITGTMGVVAELGAAMKASSFSTKVNAAGSSDNVYMNSSGVHIEPFSQSADGNNTVLAKNNLTLDGRPTNAFCKAIASASSLSLNSSQKQVVLTSLQYSSNNTFTTGNGWNTTETPYFEISNGGVKCNLKGYVEVSGALYTNAFSNSTGQVGPYIRKNNAEIVGAYTYGSSGASKYVGPVIIPVEAGDVIQLYGRSSATATAVPNNAGTYLNVRYI